ncbi:MAG: WD40 repeat domain-containing protein [Planctomycetota bacterium]
MRRPLRHEKGLHAAAFSPDGSLIVTGGLDHTARVWDTISGKPIGPPLLYGDEVFAVAFSPDGSHILVGGRGNGIQVWEAPPPPLEGETERIVLGTQLLTGLAMADIERPVQVLDEQSSRGRPTESWPCCARSGGSEIRDPGPSHLRPRRPANGALVSRGRAHEPGDRLGLGRLA